MIPIPKEKALEMIFQTTMVIHCHAQGCKMPYLSSSIEHAGHKVLFSRSPYSLSRLAHTIYGIEEVLSLACLMPIGDHKEEMDGIAFLAV